MMFHSGETSDAVVRCNLFEPIRGLLAGVGDKVGCGLM